MSNQLLTIDPVNVEFFFVSKKQMTCSIYLINKTDNYVAFRVKVTNPKEYCVRPCADVVLPRSTCIVRVTMQAQKEAPANMKCKDKFMFQCVVARPEATTEELTPEMFDKEAGHVVEETKLRVLYVAPQAREESAKGNASDFDVDNNGILCEQVAKVSIGSFNSREVSSIEDHGTSLSEYQVFINFRGDELRNTFLGFLVKAMRLEKINVYTDEVEVRGTNLNHLFRRIEESRVAVALFSERYTESRWCLDELVKMNEQMKQDKLVVIPVFYRLDPTTCKRYVGPFGDNFRNLEWEYRSEPERIQKWKEALSSVFNNIGLKSDIRSDESKFVDSIVEEVKKVLIKISLRK